MTTARQRRSRAAVAQEPAAAHGTLVRVNGPAVEAEGLEQAAMFDMVSVGPASLPGEVVSIRGATVTVQVYGYTGGLRCGDAVASFGRPLSARLGPGLIGGVFDGVLRRLDTAGDLLEQGKTEEGGRRQWRFEPVVSRGDHVTAGDVLGTVPESATITHRLLVPPGLSGTVGEVATAGDYDEDAVLATVGRTPLGFFSFWPVRQARPVRQRLETGRPLQTGQRVIDLLFPVARGSTAAVPGGFGTGKTLLLQQIAKWCDADVIVYVGCGERGNEMADVLDELPRLADPRTGGSLMDRTVVIANTSNMPVMAREASIYTGVCIAEYFRDMGLDAVVIADSTSRWAEALRELASRTDELPAEEGYPAGLASALAAFYERSGRVETLGGREGSVTVLGAVSPPGGDVTEPVTSHTRRFVRTLWSLDRDLAYARHYPAVTWRDSFSRDAEVVAEWQGQNGDPSWQARRLQALTLLAEADRLEPLAQLVGAAALPDSERITLLTGRLLREAVLQQNSLSPNDASCRRVKAAALLAMVLGLHERFLAAVERGVPAAALLDLDLSTVVRARDAGPADDTAAADAALRALSAQIDGLQP